MIVDFWCLFPLWANSREDNYRGVKEPSSKVIYKTNASPRIWTDVKFRREQHISLPPQ